MQHSVAEYQIEHFGKLRCMHITKIDESVLNDTKRCFFYIIVIIYLTR